MLMKKFNDNFASHFDSKTNYTSWSIQNTIINLCAKHINKVIYDEIKECGFYSIMVDEARCVIKKIINKFIYLYVISYVYI